MRQMFLCIVKPESKCQRLQLCCSLLVFSCHVLLFHKQHMATTSLKSILHQAIKIQGCLLFVILSFIKELIILYHRCHQSLSKKRLIIQSLAHSFIQCIGQCANGWRASRFAHARRVNFAFYKMCFYFFGRF